MLQRAFDHGATNRRDSSETYGDRHWRATALTGLHLTELTPGADAEGVVMFACLFDVMREGDGPDRAHAARAADLFLELVAEGLDGFPPDSPRSEAMEYAIRFHEAGLITDDVVVGVCWDADRLQAFRLGVRPKLHSLSTRAAKDPSSMQLGEGLALGQIAVASWERIIQHTSTVATIRATADAERAAVARA